MNALLKLIVVPFLFAFDLDVMLHEEQSRGQDDLVVFHLSPSSSPSPVTPSSATPRVRTAYETAHLALRGVTAPGSELQIKVAQQGSSGSASPVEHAKPLHVHVPQSEIQVLSGQLQKFQQLKHAQSPKTS